MEKTQFQTDHCMGEIHLDRYDLTIYGSLNIAPVDGFVYFIAPSPPDYHISYSGSALPFATKDQAFEGTPNVGRAEVSKDKHQFVIKLVMPNSYMVGLGSVTVPPTVYLSFKAHGCDETKFAVLQVSDGVPFRSLTYPQGNAVGCARHDATFYGNHSCLPVRKNQEEILRQSAYPSKNVIPTNFWGMKPSL
jgi:hypothetical protein